MGSDATEYQYKTFMDINTPHMELKSRNPHRNTCTFEQSIAMDPLPRAIPSSSGYLLVKLPMLTVNHCYINEMKLHLQVDRD